VKKSALVVLSEGFEDVEAVAPIDVLTRAGVAVTITSISPGPVAAAYGSTLIPHKTVDKVTELFDVIVIPGGMANAERLAANRQVIDLVRKHHAAGKLVAAICASSALVLGEAAGLLKGKRATGSPGSEDRLVACGATVSGDHVTVDGTIITGMGPGAALGFGLKIAESLVGRAVPDDLAARWRITR
jgi:4-methyl-5(b-hydroxyethyl)-thiazole monophosphate biosynthesis